MLGLFLGELIFGGACYRKEFCISTDANSRWAYIRERLLSEGYLRLRFEGLIFGRAYYYFFFLGGGGRGGGLLSEFYDIRPHNVIMHKSMHLSSDHFPST